MVVYPNQGVGVVETISCSGDGPSPQKFYRLHLAASNLRVLVPVANVDAVGLRRVSGHGEVEAMLQYLAQPGPVANGEAPAVARNGDWKLRFQQNASRLRGGSLLEVAEVMKSLLQLQEAKALSFREKKMMGHAAGLLVDELANAGGVSEEQALQRMQGALARAGLLLSAPEPEKAAS